MCLRDLKSVLVLTLCCYKLLQDLHINIMHRKVFATGVIHI